MRKLFCGYMTALCRLLGGGCLLCLAHAVLAADDGQPATGLQTCVIPESSRNEQQSVEQERRQQRLFDEHQGKIIDDIRFINFNVFDETNDDENNRLYLFLNKLHVHTREDVIASQLLFDVGDTLNPHDIAESERLLRSRSYFAHAYITLSEICPNRVKVTIHTQDAWTTEPQLSFGHSGGKTSSGFALSEGNFLGSGDSVTVGYSKNADRSGIFYSFSSPHFLNSRMAATIGYANNSDGEDSIIDIVYPFYSLRTPQSYGIKSEKLTQLEPIRIAGETVNEYRHKIERHEAFFGRAVSVDNDTHRLLFGITSERDSFEETEETFGNLPTDTDLLYPWVEYQFIENEFAVYRNIDQIQRTEDIAMGKNISLRLGYGGNSFDNGDDVLRLFGRYSDVLAVNDHHILKFSAYIDGRRHSKLEDTDSSVAGGEFFYYLLQDRKNRWYARLAYDIGQDLQEHEKLTVGGNLGVRGYPLDFQRGNQRYIFSLEKRYFSDVHLFNLLRLGGVVFFDAGRAWDSNAEEASPHLSNVGIGLRVSSSKTRIGHMVHIDLAFPTASKQNADEVQWLIKAEQMF